MAPDPALGAGPFGPSGVPSPTGVVLAGGRSRRLGVDKASLRLRGGLSLIENAVAVLGPLVGEVIVVADSAERFGPLPARLVHDAFAGSGALGGIYSGLAAAQSEHALVVACDMPFLSPRLLSHMLSLPRDYDVLLPRLTGGLIEPLHAVYSRRCLEPIERRLSGGEYRVAGFFEEVRVRHLDEPEIRRHDPDLRSFFNVNTPEELARARAMLDERPGG